MSDVEKVAVSVIGVTAVVLFCFITVMAALSPSPSQTSVEIQGLTAHDLQMAVMDCTPLSATFEQKLACYQAVYGESEMSDYYHNIEDDLSLGMIKGDRVLKHVQQQRKRIAELEAKLAKAEENVEKYKYAFAAQSRKLQAVLHIEDVHTTLAELKGGKE